MEEHDEHKDDQKKDNGNVTEPPKPAGVMDVQRPRPQHQDAKPEDAEHKPAPPPTTIEVSEGGEIKPAGNFESEHKTPEVIQQHIQEEHKKAEEQQQDAAKAKHKSGKPVFVILIAVLVALGLAGVAVYAYMQSNDTKSPSTSKSESTSQPAAPATSTDVDDAAKDVDEAISSVDDTKDMPESDLTDQTLGL
jgi:hypothetical protein